MTIWLYALIDPRVDCGIFYYGTTKQPSKRKREHELARSALNTVPQCFDMVLLEQFQDRESAEHRERELKKLLPPEPQRDMSRDLALFKDWKA